MVLPSEYDQMLAAWRALAQDGDPDEGWRTIRLSLPGRHQIRAGRHFPGNEEALIVGFPGVAAPAEAQLPQGQGFRIGCVNLELGAGPTVWLALSRQREGSTEMFAMMATDIIATLEARPPSTSNHELLAAFLDRVRAWQEFMRRGAETVLRPEAELGLLGELTVLGASIDVGLPPDTVVHGWVGPLGDAQDFALGTGALEVKSTLAISGFRATIGSLAQLDDAVRQPLFVAAVRFRVDEAGESLPEVIDALRDRLANLPTTSHMFSTRLLEAGYVDAAREHYKRRFSQVEVRVYPVIAGFPRLIRSGVPHQVTDARYDLELGQVETEPVSLAKAVLSLGVA